MKNIQVIDGAENTAYDIFSATDDEFDVIFPVGQDVAFIDEVMARGPQEALDAAFDRIWKRRIPKKDAIGISTACCFTSLNTRSSTIRHEKMKKPAIRTALDYAELGLAEAESQVESE